MTWGGGYGSHAETALLAPSQTWYLAEGSTAGDFNLFYLLQNPNSTAVQASVRYLRPSGQAPVERSYTLLPNSRKTIYVNGEGPSLASTDLSAVITADAPIIAERAMYTNKPGQPFAAGHESAGVTAPAMTWFLAEGATGPFFDLFVLVANPNDNPSSGHCGVSAARGRHVDQELHSAAERPVHNLRGCRGNSFRVGFAASDECRPIDDNPLNQQRAGDCRAGDVVAWPRDYAELLV